MAALFLEALEPLLLLWHCPLFLPFPLLFLIAAALFLLAIIYFLLMAILTFLMQAALALPFLLTHYFGTLLRFLTLIAFFMQAEYLRLFLLNFLHLLAAALFLLAKAAFLLLASIALLFFIMAALFLEALEPLLFLLLLLLLRLF